MCRAVKAEVVAVLHFVGAKRQRRIEDAEQPVDGAKRYLPYSEKAEQVVDAVGIEVVCHFFKASFPPGKSVLAHLFPVVCGKSPVLSVYGKSVRRRSGACVKVEPLRRYPCVDACAADAYGYVAFEGDANAVAVFAHFS